MLWNQTGLEQHLFFTWWWGHDDSKTSCIIYLIKFCNSTHLLHSFPHLFLLFYSFMICFLSLFTFPIFLFHTVITLSISFLYFLTIFTLQYSLFVSAFTSVFNQTSLPFNRYQLTKPILNAFSSQDFRYH